MLATYRRLTASAPRELTAAAIVRLAPPAPFVPEGWHLKPIVGLLICHSGPHPRADLDPLRTLSEPIFALISERPYVEQQSMLDDMDPKGFRQYWKAEYLPDLSEEYCRTRVDSALKLTSPSSYSVIFHIGGALNDNEDDDGAVSNRDARFLGGFSGVWPAHVPDDEHIAWVRDSWQTIRPVSTGGNYVNFQLADDDDRRTAEAYGKNFDRLQRIKATYDPHNLFRVNRNISPTT